MSGQSLEDKPPVENSDSTGAQNVDSSSARSTERTMPEASNTSSEWSPFNDPDVIFIGSLDEYLDLVETT